MLDSEQVPVPNAAANLVECVLRLKRPNPARSEPLNYSGPAEAFILLRKTYGITLEEMAAKLGMSTSMLHKAESGIRGATFQLDQLDIARTMAVECNLRRMSEFMRMLHIHQAQRVRRGRRQYSPVWWKEEADRGRDG